MTLETTVAALHLWFAIGILFLCAFLWADFKTDSLRESLFTIRQELFDYAVVNGFVESPAHKNLRGVFNAFIRYAHRISISRLLVLGVITKVMPMPRSNPYTRWLEHLNEVPEEHRKQLHQFHIQMMIVIIRHVLTRNIFFAVFIAGLAVCAFGKLGLDRLSEKFRTKFRPSLSALEGQALEVEGRV